MTRAISFPVCHTFFLCRSGDPPDLHSFPTRRSSDLLSPRHLLDDCRFIPAGAGNTLRPTVLPLLPAVHPRRCGDEPQRSEEHTSELQSRPHLVCRLLLEKKKEAHPEPPRTPRGSTRS